MKRIVVIHAGGIGDLVQAMPALHSIRSAWPGATITMVGRPERIVLAQMAGAADACADLDTCGLWSSGRPAADIPAVLRDADLLIDFLAQGGAARREECRRLTGGRTRVVEVPPLPPPGCRQTASAWINEEAARRVGIRVRLALPEIPVPEAALQAARRRLASLGVSAPFVAIHPGSGSTKKNWPSDRFAAIARRLREEMRRGVLWLAGPAELERGTLPAGAAPVLGDLTLPEAAGILALADAYLGNDSGISHLAAAVRRQGGRATPTVALFGPTDARIWAPSGKHVRIVESPDGSMESIGVGRAWTEMTVILA
jgi:ADP-heptose:LPS heptosyltransferase